MKKDLLIGGIVLILAIGGISLFALTQRPTTDTLTGELPATGYVEHAQYYDIAANYATSTPLSGSANAAAVALMQSFVSSTIDQFKTDGNFANLTAEDVRTLGLGPDRKETLQIVYLIGSSTRTVSYIYTIYADTLGAHGNMFFHTFVFDTTTGAALALSDVFLPGSDYLSTLSSIARAKLPEVIGEGSDASMITNGTTPEDKNFANFFFDNRDLVILFDPYAVAAYAAGPQTLRIPLSELSTLLKPEYR